MPVSLNNNVAQVNNIQQSKQPEKKTDEKSKFLTPTQTKVAVGTALTALAAVGIYLATKGKGAKVAQEMVTNATQTAQEFANTVKENTVEAFKKAGNKFNKGKALNADGTGFSGTILNQTKDGAEVSLVYENGLIHSSTKTKNGEKLLEKTYKNRDDGSLDVYIVDSKGTKTDVWYDSNKGILGRYRREKDGTNSSIVKDLKKDKILKENGTSFIYDKNGNKIAERDYNHNITLYHPNGKVKFKQEGNTLKSFDENGNMTHQLKSDLARGTKNYQLITSDGKKVELKVDSQHPKDRDMSFYEPNSKRPSAILSTWYDHTGKRINEAFARTKNGDRYLLEKRKDGVFQLSRGEVVSARYNPKNKEVEFLNDNLKEESVPVMVDNVLNAITDMRKQHRQARTIIDTYWSSNREINKLLLNNEHFMK